MAQLLTFGFAENNEVQCTECEAVFMLVWRRSWEHWQVEFCPFCGESVEHDDDEEDEKS